MKARFLSSVKVSCAGALLLLGGCAGEIVGEPDDGAGVPTAKVVFEIAYSSGGRLSVSEDASGRLSLGAIGRQGFDDPGAVTSKLDPRSLLRTFSALAPGAAVPPELMRLEQRFRQQRALELAPDTSAEATPLELEPNEAVLAQVAASSTRLDFSQTFCRDRFESNGTVARYSHLCRYIVNSQNSCYHLKARVEGDFYPGSYGKNDADVPANFFGPGVLVPLQPGEWALLGFGGSGDVCLNFRGSFGSGGFTRHMIATGT